MFLAVGVATAAKQPRVQFFTGEDYNTQTREDAMRICQNMNYHIAHESQLMLDIQDGYTGHHVCGWSWTRGRLVHVHCLERVGSKCKPGRAELRACPEPEGSNLPPPSGVYCRVFGDDDERPRILLSPGELIEVYRTKGPRGPNSIMNVNEAKAVCTNEGNKLAYWTHVAAYVERYGVQICQFSWLREINAVYNANCGHNDVIGWDVRDPSRGYDAICIGEIPHAYKDPCAGDFEFHNLEGVPIHCSDDGYIIVQDRPLCGDEEYTFNQDWDTYKKGFGEMNKGYWLGLDIISKITKAYNFELVVEVESDGGGHYSSRYDSFVVSGEEENYRLSVGEYTSGDSPGSAGDMFGEVQSNSRTSNGGDFSTRKHDNDGSEYDCAHEYGSGWWFQSCHVDNLNGPCPGEETYSKNIAATRTWRQISNNTPGLRRTRMKIKYVSDERIVTK